MNVSAAEMPRYKCHKAVWALKIAGLDRRRLKPDEEDDGAVLMTPENQNYMPIWLDHSYVSKHQPQIGGYYVVYADGYKSFSPAKAFENGYTLIP